MNCGEAMRTTTWKSSEPCFKIPAFIRERDIATKTRPFGSVSLCGEFKARGEFSSNQWRKGPDANECMDCVNKIKKLDDTLTDDALTTTTLTENALKRHNFTTEQSCRQLERRQFSCPACPKHGRGSYVFFKKSTRPETHRQVSAMQTSHTRSLCTLVSH